MSSRDQRLDVRQIPFWHRLDAVLAACDRLDDDEALELLVDIDPWPLRSYLDATRQPAADADDRDGLARPVRHDGSDARAATETTDSATAQCAAMSATSSARSSCR